jgi:signal transduction histidine kinase
VANALLERPDAWLDVVHPDDRLRAGRGAATRRARGVGGEYRIMNGGKPQLMREDAIVVGHPSGRGGHVIVSLAEDGTLGAVALGRRFEVLGRIAAAIGHDLSSFLAVVDISLQVLDARIEDASARMEVLRLRGAMESAATLTQNLLDYARGSAPVPAPVDLGGLVTRTIDVFRRVISSDVQVEVDVESDLPAVHGVASELEQLLVNLVLQGRDSMPRGGVLRVSVRAENDSSVLLEVADDGSTMAERTASMGFGVVRSVVERHGAALRIAPRSSGGTRICVTFMVVGSGLGEAV